VHFPAKAILAPPLFLCLRVGMQETGDRCHKERGNNGEDKRSVSPVLPHYKPLYHHPPLDGFWPIKIEPPIKAAKFGGFRWPADNEVEYTAPFIMVP